MNRRGEEYKCINPNVVARLVVHLKPETAAILSRIQDREQKRRDHKVAAARVITDLIHGRIKPE